MKSKQNNTFEALKHSKDSTTHKTASNQSPTQPTNVNVPTRPKESEPQK